MNINKIIQLSSAFAAEVNVQRDFNHQLAGHDQQLDGYLPNTSSRHIMKQVLDSLSPRDSRKVHLITASYGTGKSYLLLILAYLLGNNYSDSFEGLKSKILDKDDSYGDGLSASLEEYWTANVKYLIVVPSYGADDFGQAMLVALTEALAAVGISFRPVTNYIRAAKTVTTWKENNQELYKKFVSKIERKSGEDFINLLNNCDSSAYETFTQLFLELAGTDFSEMHGNLYDAFADTAQHISSHGYKGIVILHDEFGGVLDKMVNKSTQSASLRVQEFLEKIKNKTTNTNITFIAASHQDPATILDNKQQNIDKINGRFEKHQLDIGESESEELLRKVFLTKDAISKSEVLTDERVSLLYDELKDLGLYQDKTSEWVKGIVIRDLYPLHPLTAFVLPRLSNQYAQNTRSMFNFLSPYETRSGGLQSYLDTTSALDGLGSPALFRPDMLVNFFEQNLSDSHSENMASLVDSYRTSKGRRSDDVVDRVMGNILILTATREQHVVPNFDVLSWSMTISRNDLKELLDDLVREEILELTPKGIYEFPTFGARNLSKIILDEKRKIGTLTIGSCNNVWSRIDVPKPYIFHDHNDEFGTNRSFKTLWITDQEELENSLEVLQKCYQWENRDVATQGYVIHLLSKEENDIEAFEKIIERFTAIKPYLVLAHPKNDVIFDSLIAQTLEFTAFEAAQRNVEVTGNPNHIQRVKIELQRLHAELTKLIKKLFEPENWFWSFSDVLLKVEMKSPRVLDKQMEDYISKLFTVVPKVKDEVLWFTKPKNDLKTALSDILTADERRIPLVNRNHNLPVNRIITNFFQHLKITSEEKTLNKIHFGEIKDPEPGTPSEKVFKLFTKILKVDQQIPPKDFIVPLLQAPYGLSETMIKFMFTCYLRANKDNILIVDQKRTTHALDKDPSTIEELFKANSSYRIRKIEMSGFESKYLRQLNGLFNKDSYASDFGELSKRFAGLIDFVSPLQRSLMQQDIKVKNFYENFLEPFLQSISDGNVNRERVSREFFMVTLPGLFLSIGTKEEFENSSDNIPKIITELQYLKGYPLEKETEYKREVILNLSKTVFNEAITIIDEFKDVVKNWFSSLSYPAKNLSSSENPYITRWLQKLRSNESIDTLRFYLDELSDTPIREWKDPSFSRLEFQNNIKDYKTAIESFKRSPIIIYQHIARQCFAVPATDCQTEAVFHTLFRTWWDLLPDINKETHYASKFTNIFIEQFKLAISTQDRFLKYIPQHWIESGLDGIADTEWENWTGLEIDMVANIYEKIVKEINTWKPPVLESELCTEVSQVFKIDSIDNFNELGELLKREWLAGLAPNTQNATWRKGSPENLLMAAVKSGTIRDTFVDALPAQFELAEFKYWNQSTLSQYINLLSEVVDSIENYKRPIMELIVQLEARSKVKSISSTDFRIHVKEQLQSTEAFKYSAEQEEGLISDKRVTEFLKLGRKLDSEEGLMNLVNSIAAKFGISNSYYDWTHEEQKSFSLQYQDVTNFLKKWEYPKDNRMQLAHEKIVVELDHLKVQYYLTQTQIVKILKDLIEEQL